MREALRPLLVVDSLEVGGAERHVVDLAVALRRTGHEVTLACSAAGELSERLAAANVPMRVLCERLVKRRVSVAYARELRRVVEEQRFDLVHAHIYASAAAAAIVVPDTGVPLIVTEHTEGSWQDRCAQRTSRRVYQRAGYVIAVSNAIRRRLVERDGVPPGKLIVVPNAVIPASDTNQGTSSMLPDEWREGPLVGVVARLQPEKGIDTLLKAAARVSSSCPAVRFLIVGDGPLREELLGLADRLGLRERVRFLGHRTDARALIGLLDVLVVPSLTEGAPLIVLEAMAAGVPLVASAVGGIPDQLRHDREGLLIPPDDTAALGDAILELLHDPNRARRLGEAGRRRADSALSHKEMVRKIEAVYHAALGRPTVHSESPGDPG
jgi:glycosyltransferase involved in cell wall biosynthesis